MVQTATTGKASGTTRLDRRKARTRQALIDGQAAGRFTVIDADVALSTVAGGLLGLLRVHQQRPEQIDETAVDRLAEALLRMLGIPEQEAKRIAGRALPEIGAW
jgi:hypothetical protein